MGAGGFSKWVNGLVPETWEKLAQACRAAGVSSDWLLGLPTAAVRGDMASEGPPAPFDDPGDLRARVKELEEHIERIRQAVEDVPGQNGADLRFG